MVGEAPAPVELERVLAVALDLEVQRVHARLAAPGFGDLERLTAEPAPAVALGDEELVDERLAAAIFEAESERHRDVAHHRVASEVTQRRPRP